MEKRGRKGGKITDCPHKKEKVYAMGKCRKCYLRDRYWTDEEYREKTRARVRKGVKKYYAKKEKEDPEYNAKRQRNFRKEHPDSFNYCMAKCYFKKLSPEKKKKIFEEFGTQ